MSFDTLIMLYLCSKCILIHILVSIEEVHVWVDSRLRIIRLITLDIHLDYSLDNGPTLLLPKLDNKIVDKPEIYVQMPL